MERWCGRVALVTGASVGIGAAIAEKLVKAGMIVFGCARNIGAIEESAKALSGEKGKLVAVRCDVSKEDEVLAMFKRLREEHGGLDVCINNAGLAHNSPLLSGQTDDWRHMLEVNVLGLAMCTREAFKSMQEKKVDDGHIINLNSMSGHRLVSGLASGHFYAATKFAVTAMTEGARSELRQHKSNIRISQISPGLVSTEFRERFMGLTAEEQADFVKKVQHLSAEDVADAVIYQLSAPAHVQVHDVQIRPTQQRS